MPKIWMSGETLPRLVGASIIKVALTKETVYLCSLVYNYVT